MPSEVQVAHSFVPDDNRAVRARIKMPDGSMIEVSHVGIGFGLRITTADGASLEPLFGPVAAQAMIEGLQQVCYEAAEPTDSELERPN